MSVDRPSVSLAAEESRDIEFVLLGRIMHRRGATVWVEALRSGPPRIFRHRFRGPTFGVAGGRALRGTLELRNWPCGARHGRRCRRKTKFARSVVSSTTIILKSAG